MLHREISQSLFGAILKALVDDTKESRMLFGRCSRDAY